MQLLEIDLITKEGKEQRGTVDMKSSWIYAKSDLITPSMQKRGFLDVSVVKNLLANVGDSRDMGSILHLLIYIHIDAFGLWCWRRLLTVPWTARRSNP